MAAASTKPSRRRCGFMRRADVVVLLSHSKL
jgi:hypothetical protein